MPVAPTRSAMCASCGLCCNGAIFGDVPVAAEEAAELRGLGIPVESRDGRDRFAQPCAMLRGTRCSIYESRPGTCRSYRCRVLAAHERGELDETGARRRIAQAKALIAALEPHLREGQTLAGARVEWAERRAIGRSLAEDSEREERARFDLAMTALNLFLDRHFRIEAQRMVVTTPFAPGDAGAGGPPEGNMPPSDGPI